MASIKVQELTFAYATGRHQSLKNVNLDLSPGSRTLLIGANGAGKSTLLQILAGKRLVGGNADIRIEGKDAFREAQLGVSYLGTEWVMNPVVRGDIVVSTFLDSVGGYRHKERRDKLLDILDIDLDWHMHEISDGERRRVQLCYGLMTPFNVLLLDEVTVDLDVLVRNDLLNFLKADSEIRGSTIIYATHIFDGIDLFPTHVAHIRFGEFIVEPTPWKPKAQERVYDLALRWLKDDRAYRQTLEEGGKKTRGARKDQGVPSDSEIFYSKYDYSH